MDVTSTGALAFGSTTLYFGPWYRRSPFFEATLRDGCTAYDIYNHMYLPGYFDDINNEYWALVNDVVMYDVGVERTVEVGGPDADRLIDMLTCRDLTKCAVGQGKYMIVTAPDGGIVNDPVLLHVAENRWWMQLADSDAGLYALGVATAAGLDAQVSYPDAYPMQVQGPQLGEDPGEAGRPGDLRPQVLLVRLVRDRRHPRPDQPHRLHGRARVRGEHPGRVAGDRAVGHDQGRRRGVHIRPAIPSMIRRLEAGIFNYGSDMTLENNPFELSGMERLVEEQPQDYIGKEALERIRREGVQRKLVGLEIDGDELTFDPIGFWPAFSGGTEVGKVTDAVWSPRLERTSGTSGSRSSWPSPATVLDDRVRARAPDRHDGGDPVHRPEEGGPRGVARSCTRC